MTTIGQIARNILGKGQRVTQEMEYEAEAIVKCLTGKPTREQYRILQEIISGVPMMVATSAIQAWSFRNATKIAVLATLRDKGKIPKI